MIAIAIVDDGYPDRIKRVPTSSEGKRFDSWCNFTGMTSGTKGRRGDYKLPRDPKCPSESHFRG